MPLLSQIITFTIFVLTTADSYSSSVACNLDSENFLTCQLSTVNHHNRHKPHAADTQEGLSLANFALGSTTRLSLARTYSASLRHESATLESDRLTLPTLPYELQSPKVG